MNLTQISNGVISFIEAELLAVQEGWQLWGGGFALTLMRPRAEAVFTRLLDNSVCQAMGLVSEGGTVDVDAVIEALKETTRARGLLTVDLGPFGQFTFGEADFDKLKEHIMNASA